jgi:hypothetical protein
MNIYQRIKGHIDQNRWTMVEMTTSEALAKLLDDVAKLTEMVKLQNFQYTLLLKRFNDIEKLVQQRPMNLGAAMPQQTSSVGGAAVATERPPIPPPLVKIQQPAQQSPQQQPAEKLIKTTVNVEGIVKSLREGAARKQPPKAPKEPAKETKDAASADEFDFKVEENAETSGFKGQIPVTQLVYTPGGRPVCLAAVEIKDESGNVIQKIKTSSVGRWQTLLRPGKYAVHVHRRYDSKSGNDVIEYEQAFALSPTNKTVEIPAPEAYQRKTMEFKG